MFPVLLSSLQLLSFSHCTRYYSFKHKKCQRFRGSFEFSTKRLSTKAKRNWRNLRWFVDKEGCVQTRSVARLTLFVPCRSPGRWCSTPVVRPHAGPGRCRPSYRKHVVRKRKAVPGTKNVSVKITRKFVVLRVLQVQDTVDDLVLVSLVGVVEL